MSSREAILQAIRQNKPAETPLPHPFLPSTSPESDLTEKYLQVLQGIGGQGRIIDDINEVAGLVSAKVQSGVEFANGIAGLPHYNIEDYTNRSPVETALVHSVFLRGRTAIAENASIWVPESAMFNRLLPVCCQELVILIEQKDIVPDMHEAYKRTKVDEDGYGVFIAGPSKTADIEQSLVIGAHGPLSLLVLILKS